MSSVWQQLKVLTLYFLCLHISEIPVTIKGRISYNNESIQKSWLHTFLSSHLLMKTQCEPKTMLIKTQTLKCLCLHVFQFQKFLSKKAEFLITMRATKSFDTILFVSSCLQISEIPVTIKGRIFYHNESNQKSWLFCLHMCSWRLILN